MRNGLYKVEFAVPGDNGSGIVTLRDGHIGGGDSAIFYTGQYTESDGQFSGEVTTGRHTHNGIPSVFRRDVVHITLKGTVSGDEAKMNGTAKEAPGVPFTAKLSRLSD